jgi:hypothetical protein
LPSVITFRLRNMKPASVNRYLREIVLQHQQALDRGAFISVTEGKIRVRLLPMTEEQAPLYAQGREEITGVNVLRRAAGMPSIEANANRIVICARPGQSAQLRLRLRRRALKYREARLERLRSCLAEGRNDRKGVRARMGWRLENLQGICAFPIHCRAQPRRDQGGEETGNVAAARL